MRTTYYAEQFGRIHWAVIEERWDGTVKVLEAWTTGQDARQRADELNEMVRQLADKNC